MKPKENNPLQPRKQHPGPPPLGQVQQAGAVGCSVPAMATQPDPTKPPPGPHANSKPVLAKKPGNGVATGGAAPSARATGGWNSSTRSSPLWRSRINKENGGAAFPKLRVANKYDHIPSRLSSVAPVFQKKYVVAKKGAKHEEHGPEEPVSGSGSAGTMTFPSASGASVPHSLDSHPHMYTQLHLADTAASPIAAAAPQEPFAFDIQETFITERRRGCVTPEPLDTEVPCEPVSFSPNPELTGAVTVGDDRGQESIMKTKQDEAAQHAEMPASGIASLGSPSSPQPLHASVLKAEVGGGDLDAPASRDVSRSSSPQCEQELAGHDSSLELAMAATDDAQPPLICLADTATAVPWDSMQIPAESGLLSPQLADQQATAASDLSLPVPASSAEPAPTCGDSLLPVRLHFPAGNSAAGSPADNHIPQASTPGLSAVSSSPVRLPFGHWAAAINGNVATAASTCTNSAMAPPITTFELTSEVASITKPCMAGYEQATPSTNSWMNPRPVVEGNGAFSPALDEALPAAYAAGLRSNPVFEDDGTPRGFNSPLPQLDASLGASLGQTAGLSTVSRALDPVPFMAWRSSAASDGASNGSPELFACPSSPGCLPSPEATSSPMQIPNEARQSPSKGFSAHEPATSTGSYSFEGVPAGLPACSLSVDGSAAASHVQAVEPRSGGNLIASSAYAISSTAAGMAPTSPGASYAQSNCVDNLPLPAAGASPPAVVQGDYGAAWRAVEALSNSLAAATTPNSAMPRAELATPSEVTVVHNAMLLTDPATPVDEQPQGAAAEHAASEGQADSGSQQGLHMLQQPTPATPLSVLPPPSTSSSAFVTPLDAFTPASYLVTKTTHISGSQPDGVLLSPVFNFNSAINAADVTSPIFAFGGNTRVAQDERPPSNTSNAGMPESPPSNTASSTTTILGKGESLACRTGAAVPTAVAESPALTFAADVGAHGQSSPGFSFAANTHMAAVTSPSFSFGTAALPNIGGQTPAAPFGPTVPKMVPESANPGAAWPHGDGEASAPYASLTSSGVVLRFSVDSAGTASPAFSFGTRQAPADAPSPMMLQAGTTALPAAASPTPTFAQGLAGQNAVSPNPSFGSAGNGPGHESPAFSFGAGMLQAGDGTLLLTPGLMRRTSAHAPEDVGKVAAAAQRTPAAGQEPAVFGSPLVTTVLSPAQLTQLQQLAGAIITCASPAIPAGGTANSAAEHTDIAAAAPVPTEAGLFNLALLLAHLRSPRRVAVGTPQQQPVFRTAPRPMPDSGLHMDSPEALLATAVSPATSEAVSFGFSTAAKLSVRDTPLCSPGISFLHWQAAGSPAGHGHTTMSTAAAAPSFASPSLTVTGPQAGMSWAALLQQLASPMPAGRAAVPRSNLSTAKASPCFSFGMTAGPASAAPTPMANNLQQQQEPAATNVSEDDPSASPHTPPTGASPALSLLDWAGLLHEASPVLCALGLSPEQLSPKAFGFEFPVHGMRLQPTSQATPTLLANCGQPKQGDASEPASPAAAVPCASLSASNLAFLLQNLQSPLPQPVHTAMRAAGVESSPPEAGRHAIADVPIANATAAMHLGQAADAAAVPAPAPFWANLLAQLCSPLPPTLTAAGRQRSSGAAPAVPAALMELQNDDTTDAPTATESHDGGSQLAASPEQSGPPPPPYEALDQLAAMGICVPATGFCALNSQPQLAPEAAPSMTTGSALRACSSVGENNSPGGTATSIHCVPMGQPFATIQEEDESAVSVSSNRLFSYTPRRTAMLLQGSHSSNSSNANSPSRSRGADRHHEEPPLVLHSFSRSSSGSPATKAGGAAFSQDVASQLYASPSRPVAASPAHSVNSGAASFSNDDAFVDGVMGSPVRLPDAGAADSPAQRTPLVLHPVVVASPGSGSSCASSAKSSCTPVDLRALANYPSGAAMDKQLQLGNVARRAGSEPCAAELLGRCSHPEEASEDGGAAVTMLVELQDVKETIRQLSGSAASSPVQPGRHRAMLAAESPDRAADRATIGEGAGQPLAEQRPAENPLSTLCGSPKAVPAQPVAARGAAEESSSSSWASKPSIYDGMPTPQSLSPLSYLGSGPVPASPESMLTKSPGAQRAVVDHPTGPQQAVGCTMYWAPSVTGSKAPAVDSGERVTLSASNRKITANPDMLLDFKGSPARPSAPPASGSAQLRASAPAPLSSLAAAHCPSAPALPHSGKAAQSAAAGAGNKASSMNHLCHGSTSVHQMVSQSMRTSLVAAATMLQPNKPPLVSAGVGAAPSYVPLSQRLGLQPGPLPAHLPGAWQQLQHDVLPTVAAARSAVNHGKTVPAMRSCDAQTTPSLAKGHASTAVGTSPLPLVVKQPETQPMTVHTFTFDVKVHTQQALHNQDNAAQLLLTAMDAVAKASKAPTNGNAQAPVTITAVTDGPAAPPTAVTHAAKSSKTTTEPWPGGAEVSDSDSDDLLSTPFEAPGRRRRLQRAAMAQSLGGDGVAMVHSRPAGVAGVGGLQRRSGITDSQAEKVARQAKALGLHITPYLKGHK